MNTDLENHVALGDPDEPHHSAGSVDLDCPENQEEVVALLRRRMPTREWDLLVDDAMIQVVPGYKQLTHTMWLEGLFDRVPKGDHQALGKEVAKLRDSFYETLVDSVDLGKYGIHWEGAE